MPPKRKIETNAGRSKKSKSAGAIVVFNEGIEQDENEKVN